MSMNVRFLGGDGWPVGGKYKVQLLLFCLSKSLYLLQSQAAVIASRKDIHNNKGVLVLVLLCICIADGIYL